jgi:hypothetical protein
MFHWSKNNILRTDELILYISFYYLFYVIGMKKKGNAFQILIQKLGAKNKM